MVDSYGIFITARRTLFEDVEDAQRQDSQQNYDVEVAKIILNADPDILVLDAHPKLYQICCRLHAVPFGSSICTRRCLANFTVRVQLRGRMKHS